MKISWFKTLHWEIVKRNIMVTVISAWIAALVFVFPVLWRVLVSYSSPEKVLAEASRHAPEVIPLLATDTPNPVLIQERLSRIVLEPPPVVNSDKPQLVLSLTLSSVIQVAVLDPQGNVLGTVPAGQYSLGKPLLSQVASSEQMILGEIVFPVGKTDIRSAPGFSLIVVPLRDQTEKLVGHSFFRVALKPAFFKVLGDFALMILPLSLAFALAAGLISVIAGYPISRHFLRRLEQIMAMTEQWSRGDFSGRLLARGNDELGKLCVHLDELASELDATVRLRQQLAGDQERLRLARELHDTVKQQLFAVSMQIKAALHHHESAPSTSRQMLESVASTVRQTLLDLRHILENLRISSPTEARGFAALEDLARAWGTDHGIAVSFCREKEFPCTPETAQTLYRILQEALANILRHSGAKNVAIVLGSVSGTCSLTIADDGKGFDTTTPATGMGLENMRARTRSLPEGVIEMCSSPATGVKILVSWLEEVPLESASR